MTTRTLVTGLTAIGCLMATEAAADPMKGSEIRAMIAGKTVYISLPIGSLPIRYNAGGTMVAKSRAMAAYVGVSEDRGSWRIRGNGFCQRWNTWNKGKEQCFTLRRNGKTVRWTSNDGRSGTAVASN